MATTNHAVRRAPIRVLNQPRSSLSLNRLPWHFRPRSLSLLLSLYLSLSLSLSLFLFLVLFLSLSLSLCLSLFIYLFMSVFLSLSVCLSPSVTLSEGVGGRIHVYSTRPFVFCRHDVARDGRRDSPLVTELIKAN